MHYRRKSNRIRKAERIANLSLPQAYPQTPIGSAWLVANIPDLNARALTSGVYISVGNCAGLLTSNILYPWEAPCYITLVRINIGMSLILILSGMAYGLWMRWENRRRD